MTPPTKKILMDIIQTPQRRGDGEYSETNIGTTAIPEHKEMTEINNVLLRYRSKNKP